VNNDWMDHVRWSYLHEVRLLALQRGFVLVQAPIGDPDTDLEGYLTAEWSSQDAESALFTLVEQATGDNVFPEGVTLGQIEDYLSTAKSL
jgi:hypothetical protein